MYCNPHGPLVRGPIEIEHIVVTSKIGAGNIWGKAQCIVEAIWKYNYDGHYMRMILTGWFEISEVGHQAPFHIQVMCS